jgi:hypothetical protein
MDQLAALSLGFDDPLEGDRMTFRHVGTHDHDAI